jgi:hypothetical protein
VLIYAAVHPDCPHAFVSFGGGETLPPVRGVWIDRIGDAGACPADTGESGQRAGSVVVIAVERERKPDTIAMRVTLDGQIVADQDVKLTR